MLTEHRYLTTWAMNHFHMFAYRKNGLVYVPTLKSACTYYYTLCLANGFERIQFSDIDWESDHVFGFIMDPVKRYFKGLIEDLILCEQSESVQLVDTVYNLLETFPKYGFPISSHCIPVTTTLSLKAHEIDWIPLYNNHIPSHDLFLRLCKQYGITINHDDPTIDPHVSNIYKKELFDKFYQLSAKLDDSKTPSWYVTLAQDIELYYNVVERINPNGRTWTEVSWLSNTNGIVPVLEGHDFASRLECHCKLCQQGTKKETETIHIGTKIFRIPTSWTDLNVCPECGLQNCKKADAHHYNCSNQ